MKRCRNFPSVKGTRRGGGGIFLFKMSVDVILKNYGAIFSCENKLILQALAVFQMLSTAFLNPHHKCINKYFDPSVGFIISGGGIKLDSF